MAGRDIHGFIEINYGLASQPNWRAAMVLSAFVNRNEEVFSQLDYVTRNRENPMLTRGVPDDSDHRTKDEAKAWAPVGHSHSFITMTEIQRTKWVNLPYAWSTLFKMLKNLAHDYGRGNIRIVYWYDN